MEHRDHLRTTLEAELASLLRRKERLEGHLHRELPRDSEERATATEDDEVVEALDERTRIRVGELRHALLHFEDADAGLCSACGQAIALRRLAALPTTTLCVHCAELAEA